MGNEVDTAQASRDAHTAFAEKAQDFEQAAQNAQPAPEPNQADLQWLNAMQSKTGADGRRIYQHDSQFRERLEAARISVFSWAAGSIGGSTGFGNSRTARASHWLVGSLLGQTNRRSLCSWSNAR